MLVAAIAVVLPIFGFTPRLYNWLREQRLRGLYRRLRTIEHALLREPSVDQVDELQKQLEEIDRAASVVPMRDSDLFFIFRQHLDQTRLRLAARLAETQDRITEIAR